MSNGGVAVGGFDDADRTTAEELANRARTSYVYDHAGRLTGLRNMDSSLAVLSSFTYTYLCPCQLEVGCAGLFLAV